jgi:hypothetical protein
VAGGGCGAGDALVSGCGSGKVGWFRWPLSNTIDTADGGGNCSG